MYWQDSERERESSSLASAPFPGLIKSSIFYSRTGNKREASQEVGGGGVPGERPETELLPKRRELKSDKGLGSSAFFAAEDKCIEILEGDTL